MPLLRIAASLLAAAAAACVVAPASRLAPEIAGGVSVEGVAVGGMTSEPARAALERAFAAPVTVVSGDRSWTLDRSDFRVRATVDAAVARAFDARPGETLPIRVRDSRAAVDAFVRRIARELHRAPKPARLVGFDGRPKFAPAEPGTAVREDAAARALEAALATPGTQTVSVPTREIEPRKTVANFGPVIVIDRARNSLRLFDGRKPVRTFGVATGQAVYPTPAGLFHIVTMQRDPWWIPPPSPWAAGEKPVPPGPGNPLGTRWMGIDSPGVGIHGTPNDASIGYSRSHGCVRMHIPDAEWLFGHVDVGTPVLIR